MGKLVIIWVVLVWWVTYRLWEKKGKDDNDAGRDKLNPYWDSPSVIVVDI